MSDEKHPLDTLREVQVRLDHIQGKLYETSSLLRWVVNNTKLSKDNKRRFEDLAVEMQRTSDTLASDYHTIETVKTIIRSWYKEEKKLDYLDLLPCPFCGNAVLYKASVVDDKERYDIECRNDTCYMNGESSMSHMHDLSIVWNRRA